MGVPPPHIAISKSLREERCISIFWTKTSSHLLRSSLSTGHLPEPQALRQVFKSYIYQAIYSLTADGVMTFRNINGHAGPIITELATLDVFFGLTDIMVVHHTGTYDSEDLCVNRGNQLTSLRLWCNPLHG